MYKSLSSTPRPRQHKVITDVEKLKRIVKRLHVVDQIGIKDFALGSNGWPSSQISVLARANSLEEYNMIAQYLKRSEVVSDNSEGLTIEERFSLIRPRSVQLPHSFESFAEKVGRVTIDNLNKRMEQRIIADANDSSVSE